MKRTLNYAILACAVAAAPVALAEESNCNNVSETVIKLVTARPDNVLAIVERQTSANPTCSCEVVKAAIVATEADVKLVSQIVATAIEAAPDKLSIITSCAIAVAPDALPEIKAVLAKLDPKGLAQKGNDPVGAGAKGGLSPIVAEVRDPVEEAAYLVPGLPPIHPPLVPSTCTADEFLNINAIRLK
ncbi:MAG: hypothetical protein VCA73_15875 [Roseibacillus sp.]|jgi:hypothetical protein